MSEWDDERVTPQMLSIVDPEPAVAVVRYRRLLSQLRWSLEAHGCRDADDVASEAVSRALQRLAGGVDTAQAGLRAYVFGIAKLVAKERQRKARREPLLSDEEWAGRASQTREHAAAEARLMLEDVRRLLGTLAPADRQLLLRYSTEDDHTAHCQELGVTPVYLRVKIHRLREWLRRAALPARERGGSRARVNPGRPAPSSSSAAS